MKTASIRQVQHGLKAILDWVEAGEKVSITRRNIIVAEMSSPKKTHSLTIPNFKERLKKTFPHPIKGPSNAELIIQERNSR
ncbi:MAG: hypothetical protein A3F67_04770 [Verrucomicrobia bacterium RIFCSPHIGHO2_12_FULL_41_10]|nr:MAG: hypothetical protein A3F67_04770 [Verrucomicrobia bacterium RIFCSPHIGHO2_12_FULL_41_10]HLB34248.1 hypothetical protein [Chthoniobacterales bacterium]